MSNKIVKSKNSDSQSNQLQTNDFGSNDEFLNSIKKAEQIAEYVINSKTFGAAFEKTVVKLDKDGNEVLDKNGNPVYTKYKDKNDVISAILIGQEIGIPPMTAIAMGGKLKNDAFIKVRRGKALGIDPITALDVIDIVPSGSGDKISLGVGIITKVLLDNHVKIEFLKDYANHYIYINSATKEEIDIETLPKDSYYIVTSASKATDITQAKTKNQTLLIRKATKITTIKLTRGNQSITKSYTLQMATDAGLYKGVTTDGVKVKGKDNWNNHPYNMLTNRPLTIAGRLIIGDKLYTSYSSDEISEFTDYPSDDNNAKDYMYVDITDTKAEDKESEKEKEKEKEKEEKPKKEMGFKINN